MINEFQSLINLVLLYGAINIGVRLFLNQPPVSAALAFWFGWWFLLTGGLYAVDEGWREITLFSAPYIRVMFHGAFIGFLAGSIAGVIAKPKNATESYNALIQFSEDVFSVLGYKVLAGLFLVGMIFFYQRVASIGLSMDYLSDARDVYNKRQGGILLQLGSHLSVLMTTMIVMRGVYDAKHGVKIAFLALIIIAGAPLGLANGGRTFLLSYMMTYLASFMLCRSNFGANKLVFSVSEGFRILASIMGLLLIFALMGFLRGGYGYELDIVYTVLIWPVSTLQAMDTWVSTALISERTYGLHSFGWIADFGRRVGLVDITEASKTMREHFIYFEVTNDSARVIPRSILPDLIFDFGAHSVLWTMALIAFLLEVATSRFAGRGIFWHVLAVTSLVASFATIQNSVVTPGFAVTVFWGGVLALFSKKISEMASRNKRPTLRRTNFVR